MSKIKRINTIQEANAAISLVQIGTPHVPSDTIKETQIELRRYAQRLVSVLHDLPEVLKDCPRACDVTNQLLSTNTKAGCYIRFEDNYNSDLDGIHHELSRPSFIISEELLHKTMKYWKTLPEFNTSDEMKIVYDILEKAGKV